MNLPSFIDSLFSNLIVRRILFVSILVICILISWNGSYTPVNSFLFLAKWMSLFFVISYTGLVFISYFKNLPKLEDGNLDYFSFEALPLVYICFAFMYISIGAFHIEGISKVSWLISENMKAAIKPEKNEHLWHFYIIYQTYLPIMLGYIIMTLIINCSRSYYQIHELDLGKGDNKICIVDNKNWGTKVDWGLRFFIAIAFFSLEKEISMIGILNEMELNRGADFK